MPSSHPGLLQWMVSTVVVLFFTVMMPGVVADHSPFAFEAVQAAPISGLVAMAICCVVPSTTDAQPATSGVSVSERRRGRIVMDRSYLAAVLIVETARKGRIQDVVVQKGYIAVNMLPIQDI